MELFIYNGPVWDVNTRAIGISNTSWPLLSALSADLWLYVRGDTVQLRPEYVSVEIGILCLF